VGLAILAAFFMWPGVAEMVVLQVRLLTGLTPTRAHYVSPWRPASLCRGLAEPSVKVSEQDFLWLATRSGGRDVDALVAAAVTSRPYREGHHELAFYTFDTLSDVAPGDARSWAAVVYQRQLGLNSAVVYRQQGPTGKLDAHAYRHLDEAVKHGRSLEPDNAFWDLVEMALAVADEDDPRVVQALLRGADKPRFDDHRQAVRATVFRACRELSLSRYRAKLTALQLFRPRPSVFLSDTLARHVAGVAVQFEQDGQAAEAVPLYAAALRLDRLVRSAPDTGEWHYPERRKFSGAAAAWEERHCATEPPPESWSNDRARLAWEARAFHSFQAFAREQGADDLAAIASEAYAARAKGRAEFGPAWREDEQQRVDLALASVDWWLQLVALAELPVLIAAMVAFRRLAARLRRDPDNRWGPPLVGLTIAAVCALFAHVALGLMPPSHTALHLAPPHTLRTALRQAAVILLPWPLPLALGVNAFAWQLKAQRSLQGKAHMLAEGAVKFTGVLVAFLLMLYLVLTIRQATFQAEMVDLLP